MQLRFTATGRGALYLSRDFGRTWCEVTLREATEHMERGVPLLYT